MTGLGSRHSSDEGRQDSGDQGFPVAVGERFYKVGVHESVWVVKRIFNPRASDIPHAVIEQVGGGSGSGLISLTALLDTRVYRPDRRGQADRGGPGQDEPTPYHRRRWDTLSRLLQRARR